MDKSKGRYWTAFTFLCVTLAWLTINIVWWTRTRVTEELAVPALLALLGSYIFFREERKRRSRSK